MSWQALRLYLDHASGLGHTHAMQKFTRLHGRMPAHVPGLGFIVVKAECAKGWPTEQSTKAAGTEVVASAAQQAALTRAAQVLQLSAWEAPLIDPDLPQVLTPCG